MNLLVEKIISGGQTGADMGGLIAAHALGIQSGGAAPKGYRTENGDNPELGSVYGLIEYESDQYPPRTMQNVDDSDGTIAFLFRSSHGTERTVGYCHLKEWVSRKTSKINGYRPVLVITRIGDNTIEEIRSFIIENNIHVLNVAGHRESKRRGIQKLVAELLEEAFVIDK